MLTGLLIDSYCPWRMIWLSVGVPLALFNSTPKNLCPEKKKTKSGSPGKHPISFSNLRYCGERFPSRAGCRNKNVLPCSGWPISHCTSSLCSHVSEGALCHGLTSMALIRRGWRLLRVFLAVVINQQTDKSRQTRAYAAAATVGNDSYFA